MKRDKKMFPMYTDLTQKKVLIIGGGPIGERRAVTLLDFAGEILVISPSVTDRLRTLAEEEKIVWVDKKYEREDLYDADLVLAATDSREVNEDIYSACKCLGIPVNVSSDRTKCDFHFPGILIKDDIVIGFNGGGNQHKKTKEMREKVQHFLERPEEAGWKKEK